MKKIILCSIFVLLYLSSLTHAINFNDDLRNGYSFETNWKDIKNIHNGTSVGSPTFGSANCPHNNCVLLGMGNYGNFASKFILEGGNTPLTISFWMNYTGETPGAAFIIMSNYDGDGNQFLAYLDTNNLMFGRRSNSQATTFPINWANIRNEWVHIVLIYSGGAYSLQSSFQMYFNGVNVTSNGRLFMGGSSTLSYIGADQSDISPLVGYLDEMYIFNGAVTESEVLLLYLDGIGLFEPFTLNSPPYFNESIGDIIINHNSTLFIQINATDFDNDSINYTSNSSVIPINLITGIINTVFDINDTGIHDITITITDNNSNTNSTNFQVNITNTNPIIDSISLEPVFARNYSIFTCTINNPFDSDNDIITKFYKFQNDTHNFSSFSETNTFDCSTEIGCYDNQDIFCYAYITDSISNSSILISNGVKIIPNMPPYFNESIGDIIINHNSTLFIQINATDFENDSINYTSNSSVVPINLTTGLINVSFNIFDTGIYDINITITDNNSNTNSTNFQVNITNTNPVIDSVSLIPLIAKNISTFICTIINNVDLDNDITTMFYKFQNDTHNFSSFSETNTFNCSTETGCYIGINISCHAYSTDNISNSSILQSNLVQILDLPSISWENEFPLNNTIYNTNISFFFTPQLFNEANCSLMKINSTGNFVVDTTNNIINGENISLNYTVLINEVSINDFYINCSDSDEGKINSSQKHILIDLESPIIIASNPNSDGSSSFKELQPFTLNIKCIDDNLFEAELNISKDGITKFFDYTTNIQTTTFNYTNVTQFSEIGNYVVNIICGDDHNPTSETINPEYIKKTKDKLLQYKDDKLELKIELIEHNKPFDSFYYEIKDNKIKWQINFTEINASSVYTSVLDIKSNMPIYIRDAEKGHFVIPKQKYISFEDEYYYLGSIITVERINEKRIKVHLISDRNIIDPFIGNLNNASLNYNFTIIENTAPTIIDFSPVITSYNEGVTISFSVSATDEDTPLSYIYYKDGINVSNDSTWDFVVGGDDSGSYNISVIISDSFGKNSSVTWAITIANTIFTPSIPNIMKPSLGFYEHYIPVECGYGLEKSNLLFTFNIEARVNKASWFNISLNNSLGLYLFDIQFYNINDTFDFRCKSFNTQNNLISSGYAVALNNTKTDVHNFYMFTPGIKPYMFSNIPYQVGIVAEFDGLNNTKIEYLFLDCNGDTLWDYSNNYDFYNISSIRKIYNCENNEGIVKHTIGIVFKRLNTNTNWGIEQCKKLPPGSTRCVFQKSYKIKIR